MNDDLKWLLVGILAGGFVSFAMTMMISSEVHYHKGIKAHYKGEYECATALDKVVCREVEK